MGGGGKQWSVSAGDVAADGSPRGCFRYCMGIVTGKVRHQFVFCFLQCTTVLLTDT